LRFVAGLFAAVVALAGCGGAAAPPAAAPSCVLPAVTPGPPLYLYITTDLSACGEGIHENDDAFAMAWALRNTNVTVVGIGVAHGNAGADAAVTACAQKLVALSGKAVPVYAGAPSAAALGRPTPSSRAMSDLSRTYGRKLWLSSQGTTTDLATAVLGDPGLAGRVGGVLVMAGVLDGVAGRMNFDPVNSLGDMPALDVVLRTYEHIVVTPLDLNEDDVLTRAEWNALAATGDPLLTYIHDQSRAWMDLMAPFIGGFYNFDSLGYAALFYPGLLVRHERTPLGAKFGSLGWVERSAEARPVSDVWLDIDLPAFRVAYLRDLGVPAETLRALTCGAPPRDPLEP
jgi:inosine-uridine nucleoside N-ribohydrolase